jgi:phosphoribosyl 1,2-cyclic phosphodiesterase
VKVTFWGTRGSLATPGPETVIYGGDTSCVTIAGSDPEHLVVLDAGTGIRRLGAQLSAEVRHIDLFLSHLHLDHILGLGFFAPLFRDDLRVTIWAPAASTSLLDRLGRYLSPPLFPVRLRDLSCELQLRDASEVPVSRGEFTITATSIIHPDIAVGYRLESGGQTVAYLPDHEPVLSPSYPTRPRWTSGLAVAHEADLLIHDAQYTNDEYSEHVGWGHSSVDHALAFAQLAGARRLVLFHHDPAHDDSDIERMEQDARGVVRDVVVEAAREGTTVTLPGT